MSLPAYKKQATAMSFHPKAAHIILAYSDQRVSDATQIKSEQIVPSAM